MNQAAVLAAVLFVVAGITHLFLAITAVVIYTEYFLKEAARISCLINDVAALTVP